MLFTQKYLQHLGAAFFWLLSSFSVAHAESSTFILTPNVHDISMGTGDTAIVYYSVYNNSPQNFTQETPVSVFDTYPTSVAEAVVVLDSMTTCPSLQFPLAAKTSCTLGFQVSAKSVGEFVLAPKVCEYSGQRCSRPEEDEQVDITVTTPAEDAFVLTPNVTNVSMGTGNTVVVYYTILNASTENFSEVEVADTFSTPVAEAEAVLDANTTCPDLTFPLAPGASCIMGFAITGLSAGEYSLAPEICGFSSEAFCSQPAPTDRVAVTISTAPAFFLFTPNTPSISLAVGATETVYYTVKNMTADNFSTVSVENTFSTDVATATAVLDVNTTCPSLSFPLAAGAECILGFEIIGGGAPGGAGVGSLTLLNVANTLYVGTLGQGVWSLAVPFYKSHILDSAPTHIPYAGNVPLKKFLFSSCK